MPDDFLVAVNPEPGSKLPYLIRLPLGPDGVVLKVRETWPRTGKVYCHPATTWPAEPEILDVVPTRSCVRRGASIELVLDRGRESRSQIVFTTIRGGREAIFWQTARTAKQARPRVALPTARASGVAELEILVDSGERYAWKFADQQAATRRQSLHAGDYAVEHAGRIVAVVERKSLQDLVSGLMNGTLRFQLTELATVDRAAVVVEDRYSSVFKLEFVRPAVVADAIAECQARYPGVPIMFCETRPLAQEWTFRFFGAALAEAALDDAGAQLVADLPAGLAAPPGQARERKSRSSSAESG